MVQVNDKEGKRPSFSSDCFPFTVILSNLILREVQYSFNLGQLFRVGGLQCFNNRASADAERFVDHVIFPSGLQRKDGRKSPDSFSLRFSRDVAVVFRHGRISMSNDFSDNRQRNARIGAERHERMPERMKTIDIRGQFALSG